jgi:large subunit ribosomal protein L21
MQAVFQLSGFQFNAHEGEILRVPHQKVGVGESFEIDQVLMLKDKDTSTVGTPTVDGAKIEAEVLGNGRDDKVAVFKFKRRTKYRRTRGHRRDYSEIKIKRIVKPS